jgi:hypothetical protein
VGVPLHLYFEVTAALFIAVIRRAIVPTRRLQASSEAPADIIIVTVRSAAAVEVVIGAVAVVALLIALVVA